MATTKFDPYRTTGGTIELVRDPKTGAYSTKTVGFAKLPVLNLPTLGTAAATTTAATTKTATDLTGTTTADQTKAAFREPQNDRSLDLDLTSRAKDISESLSDIDSGRGGDSASAIARQTANLDMGGTPMDVERRQQRQLGMTDDERRQQFQTSGLGIQKATGDIATQGQSRFSGDADTTGVTVKDTSVIDRSPTFLKNLFGEPRGVEVARGKKAAEFTDAQTRADITTDEAVRGTGTTMQTQERSDLPSPQDRTLGISARPEMLGDTGASVDQMSGTKLDTARFAGSTAGTLADPAEKEDVKPASKKTFSESVKTALKGFKTPTMAILESVSGALTDPRQKALNDSNAAALGSLGYKTRGQLGSSTDPGRIAGNPANDVFAGLNLKSARGDVMRGARNRVSTVQKTIDKALAKGDIEKAKRYQERKEKYNRQIEKAQKKKNEADLATGGVAPGASGGNRGSGRKIVCTMMNESYGFGSFRNKIWLRQSKNLAPEYQIGYHKLFLPLVKYAKQKGITNSIVKKTLEHIAIHRTIDIRQEEKNKIHLIGRVYRKILEPICYWAGKK